MKHPRVRQAGQPDLNDLVHILAEGFHDDPCMTWCFNGPAAVEPMLRIFSERQYLPHGIATLSEGRDAAALWLAPGTRLPFDPIADLRMARVLMKSGGLATLSRALRFSRATAAHHPPEPHYYLFAIATTRASRGKGLGGALLKEGVARADADGVGCYLESSREENLGIYGAHGFRLLNKIYPLRNSPPMWRMWREPQCQQIQVPHSV